MKQCPACGSACISAKPRTVFQNGRIKCPQCNAWLEFRDAQPRPHFDGPRIYLLSVLGGSSIPALLFVYVLVATYLRCYVAGLAHSLVLLSLVLIIWAPFFRSDVIRRRRATLVVANFQGDWMSVAGARAAWADFLTPASRQALRTLPAFALGVCLSVALLRPFGHALWPVLPGLCHISSVAPTGR